MTPFVDLPKCELCETEKNTVCVSEEYKLFLCQRCREKMSIYWGEER
jgi:hypothetical protein